MLCDSTAAFTSGAVSKLVRPEKTWAERMVGHWTRTLMCQGSAMGQELAATSWGILTPEHVDLMISSSIRNMLKHQLVDPLAATPSCKAQAHDAAHGFHTKDFLRQMVDTMVMIGRW